jgi:hypothetical protein
MTHGLQTWVVAPPSSKRLRLTVKLTATELAILALVVVACLSALLDLAQFMGLV